MEKREWWVLQEANWTPEWYPTEAIAKHRLAECAKQNRSAEILHVREVLPDEKPEEHQCAEHLEITGIWNVVHVECDGASLFFARCSVCGKVFDLKGKA